MYTYSNIFLILYDLTIIAESLSLKIFATTQEDDLNAWIVLAMEPILGISIVIVCVLPHRATFYQLTLAYTLSGLVDHDAF